MDITKHHYDRLTDEIHTLRAIRNMVLRHLDWRISQQNLDIVMTDQELLNYINEHNSLLNERLSLSLRQERSELEMAPPRA